MTTGRKEKRGTRVLVVKECRASGKGESGPRGVRGTYGKYGHRNSINSQRSTGRRNEISTVDCVCKFSFEVLFLEVDGDG